MEETGKIRALSLVRGECPACLLSTLFVGEGGHLTCSNVECPCPDTMVAFKVRESGMPFHRKGDRLPTGEEFIGYTGDGTPMWNEPVARPASREKIDAALDALDGLASMFGFNRTPINVLRDEISRLRGDALIGG